MTEDDLKKRTKQFALRVLKLVAALPKTVAGRTIGGQLARSSTSVAVSAFWLELIIEGDLMKRTLVEPLWNEANEILAIITSSRQTASRSILASPRTGSNRRSKIANQKSKIP
jgi:hypothetical protein